MLADSHPLDDMDVFPPGEPLDIRHETSVVFHADGQSCSAPAAIELHFSPCPELRIRVGNKPGHDCTGRMARLFASTASCRIGGVQTPHRGSRLELPELGLSVGPEDYLVTFDLHAEPPVLIFSLPTCCHAIGNEKESVSQIRFLVPNLDSVSFPSNRADSLDRDGTGQVEMRSDRWQAALEVTETTGNNIAALPEAGYAITQIGTLRQMNGESFPASDGAEILTDLAHLLSFIDGSLVGFCAVRGLNDTGATVWEEISAPDITPWRRTEGVVCSRATDCLRQCWQQYLNLTAHEEHRAALHRAIRFYALACESVDAGTGLVQAQVALESLSRLVIVSLEQSIPGTTFRRMHASDQVAALVRHMDLDGSVPQRLKDSVPSRARRRWETGPQAVANVRNWVVHGMSITKRGGEQTVRTGRDIAVQYVELVLLRLFGYHGHYWDRVEQRHRELEPNSSAPADET